MHECCASDRRDLVNRPRVAILLWGFPAGAFILGCLVDPAFRTLLWAGASLVAGGACLFNALRCGRVHCYLTGSFWLIGTGVVLAYGLEALPLGPRGWIWIGATLAGGGAVLTVVPERLWRKYVFRA